MHGATIKVIVVHLLLIVQNNRRCTVHLSKNNKIKIIVSPCNLLKFPYALFSQVSIVMEFELACRVIWASFLAIIRNRC